jgi:hypothetical protein
VAKNNKTETPVTKAVDPTLLTECFAVFVRVQSGITRYLRDDHDTYSPMMAKLREDKVFREPIIDSFLAVQRLLSLRGQEGLLFNYTNRVLFMALAMESAPDDKLLPFLGDPGRDQVSASFFKTLACAEFDWGVSNPKDILQMMADVMERMYDTLSEEGHDPKELIYEFNRETVLGVEELVPGKLQRLPTDTLH